jgi:DNA-binding IclR family transcriptional regulator
MGNLHIAKGFSLPLEVVTQAIGILAKRRAGKSYLARRFTEQLLRAHQQIVIVDPKGDWWGIRSSADGKLPGLPVVILGGDRGDVKLEPGAGEVVAKLVVEERVSALLDLSLFRKHEVASFMATFLENLYRLKAREQFRTPMMLAIDEADAIAPQKPQKGEERMLGAAEDIVRRGGQRGIGCTMISQRSAVLNKNVLTQIQVLIALRTIAPQDLAALDAWIDVHGTPEERKALMESLPALPTGDAWVWSPGWPTNEGIFEHVHVLPIETFDSGATPKPGEKRTEPKNLADVDLDALKRQMSETIERAKAEDPRELRRQIAELKAAQKKVTPAPVVDPKALQKAHEEGYARGRADVEQEHSRANATVSRTIEKCAGELTGLLDAMRPQLTTAPARIPAAPRFVPPHTQIVSQRPPIVSRTPVSVSDDQRMAIGEKKILTACAQYPDGGCTRDQLTVLTGYKRSSRDTYLQRLQARGYIQAGLSITATAEGIAALGPSFEPLPPSGAQLLEHWRGRLPEGERKILDVLVNAYPGALQREALDEATGYRRSSRDTYLQRLRSRRLVEVMGRGELRASEELFV